jgi:hypothetical protein
MIVYDFELGVIVRCHWCPPWQDRHYFRALRRPKVDRREVMPPRRMQKPQEFYRDWSLSSVFDPQLSPTSVPADHVRFFVSRAIGGLQHTIPAPPHSTRSDF